MNEMLKTYIERVEKLRQEDQTKITSADLEDIARQVGLTDKDFAAVDRHVEAARERASGFAEHGLWDDAIAEYEDALAFVPTQVEVLLEAASAYLGRARATGSSSDRERALQHARECLRIDPTFDPAFKVLAELRALEDGSELVVTDQAQTSGSRSTLIISAVAGLTVLAVGGLMVPLAYFADAPDSAPSIEVPVKSPDRSRPPTSDGQPDLSGDHEFRTGEVEGVALIPVDSPQGRGLVLHAPKSAHKVYPEKSFYELHAVLQNVGSREFDEVKAELTFVGRKNAPLKTYMANLVRSHQATLRPGDRLPFSVTIEAPREFEELRIKVVEAQARKAEPYAQETPVELLWAARQPDTIDLHIAERSEAGVSNQYFRAEWTLRNDGPGYVKRLKLELIVYGQGDSVLGRRDWFVAYSGTGPMAPGDIWPQKTILKVDEPYARYEIRVLEIQ